MEKTPTSNIKTIEQKKKFKVAIVDTTDLMRSQAEDAGKEKMTIEAESSELAKLSKWEKLGKGEYWSRLGQKVWKYGLKRDYNLNKEIYKASQEILKTDNVFAGEGKEKASHDKVMSDILNQFTSGYDEAIHKEAGEKKVEIGKDELEEEATGDKESVKQLIMDWATGKISKESFIEQEKRIFHNLKGNIDDKKIKGNTMYASNLFEIAEQVKLAIENKEFLDNEDLDVDLIYGKSKANVRTEANYSKTESIINKMLHTKVGQFANETSISIALSFVASMVARSAVSLPGKIVPIIGTAAISSWFAKQREQTEQENKRVLHSRQLAKGESFDSKTMPNRVEMDKFKYQTESASNLIKNIDTNLNLLETNAANITEQELNSVFADLASLEALIRLSDRRKIDLVTYSDSTKVVEERLTLDIKKRQIKDALEKAYNSGNHAIPNGQKFEEYFNSLATTEENRLISAENIGIDAQDRNFNKFKSEKGNKAAWTAFKTGIVIGATFQEALAGVDGLWGGERVSVVEDIMHDIKGGHTLVAGAGVEHLTSISYLKHLIEGDMPKMSMGNVHESLIGENHIKLPEGVNMIKNPDGTYNLTNGSRMIAEHLTVTPEGSLTEEAKNILSHSGVGIENHLVDGTTVKTVGVGEYIKNHLTEMKKFHRLGWFDNNTKDFDLNELKTQWGGLNGSGIDAKGNYILNVGHMTADGSFHGDLNANAEELMKSGKLKMLFSLSKETQNQAFEITVNPNGEIVIPQGSEAGKILFGNINGHALFHGRFGEVAQDMGNDSYRILGTLEGKGLDDIIDKVKIHTEETILNTQGIYDGELPPFIAVVPGNPLEKLIANKKTKEEGGDKNKEKLIEKTLDKKVGIVEIESSEEEKGDKENDSEKTKEKDAAFEISKEEYDGMYDDLKMLNKRILESKGIITLENSDFKSEYGRKRYMDLKSIQESRSKGFNKTENELQKIGDEIEGLLSRAKIVSKKEMAEKLERENKAKIMESNLKADLEMLNKNIRDSKGIITLEESDFKSDFGKEKYRSLKSIPLGKSKGFNKTGNELQIIGEEMGKYLSNFQEIVNGKKEIIHTEKEKILNVETKNEKVSPTVEKEVVQKEAAVEDKKESESIKSEIKESNSKKEKLYTSADLLKFGTEFTSEENSYIVVKAPKSRNIWNMLSPQKVEVIATDKKGKETIITYTKKYLENKFEKGNIKITKTLEKNN